MDYRTSAVLLFIPGMPSRLISPNTDPSDRVARTSSCLRPITCTFPDWIMYISFPTSPFLQTISPRIHEFVININCKAV